MALSPSKELTAQFYEWEQLGRGHLLAEYPADLEPPFTPFFRHFVERGYIDDGVRPHFFKRLLFGTPQQPPQERQPIVIEPFEDENDEPLYIYAVAMPKQFNCKAESIEQCLTLLALSRTPISFEILATRENITVQFVARESAHEFLYTQLRAFFPDCTIIRKVQDLFFNAIYQEPPFYTVDFGLREEFMRPMAQYSGSHHDAFTPFFSTLEYLQPGEMVVLQTIFCGTGNPWADSIIHSVTDGKKGSFFLNAPEMPGLANNKVSRPLVAATTRLMVMADSMEDAQAIIQRCGLVLIHSSTSDTNSLQPLKTGTYNVVQRLTDLFLRQSHRLGMLLNTKELATLVHIPAGSLSRKLHSGQTATHRAPLDLHYQDYFIGDNEHQGETVPVGLPMEIRVRHIHIIGSTGVGKSTLLRSLIMQDVTTDIGCCVLDPYGDLIESVLAAIPEHRIKDVVLIDPSDTEHPVAFNILSAHTDHERELLASDLVALFKRFSTSWGDQLHSVFANAIMAFLYNKRPGHLGDLRKFLIDKQYRAEFLKTCTDAELIYYWTKEYPLLKTSSIGSILTRLDSFLRPRVIRNMICQPTGLNITELMGSQKIILVKLSQGLIGAENSYLLGALIVAKLQQSAMARQLQAAANRKPFFCYIDEFHHFVSPSMSTILSGTRQFNFGLVLAHQNLQQVSSVDTDVANSVLSNATTRICFRLGDTDAKRLQEGFAHFTADDLQNLGVGQALMRCQTNDADCNVRISPWESDEESHRDAIIVFSRVRYGVPVATTTDPIIEPEPVEQSPTPPVQAAPEPQQTVTPPQQEPTPIEATPPVSELQTRTREKPVPREADEVREHRYLQSFIKTLGQSHGYKGSIEIKTPNGAGQVDVLLEKDGKTIAVEISVTNTIDYELGNVRKCIEAGYTLIVLCCPYEEKLKKLSTKVKETFKGSSNIRCISPADIPSLFVTTATEPAVTTKNGYRVKVKYENTADGQNQELLKSIVSAFRKPQKD